MLCNLDPGIASAEKLKHDSHVDYYLASSPNAKTLQLHLAQPEPPSSNPRYFIVDEASLASTRMVYEFMRKLGPEDRVLFVGDTRQHESIEAGRIYAQMREAGMVGTTLSHIIRQRNSPELKAVVEHLAVGTPIGPWSC